MKTEDWKQGSKAIRITVSCTDIDQARKLNSSFWCDCEEFRNRGMVCIWYFMTVKRAVVVRGLGDEALGGGLLTTPVYFQNSTAAKLLVILANGWASH